MPQHLALPHRRESALPYAFAFENIGYGRIPGAVRVLCVKLSFVLYLLADSSGAKAAEV